MTDKYAVIGHPISHSQSPQIHQLFAAQTGQDIFYDRIEAPLGQGGFSLKVNEFVRQGGKGMSVTVPFKLQAFLDADEKSVRAVQASAANTLWFKDGKIFADNTDGIGLIRDIHANLGISLTDKRVLLLGAGGAAQGVIYPLSVQSPALLHIANRTKAKAEELVTAPVFSGSTTRIQAKGFNELTSQQYDVIINATSTGLTDSELPVPPTIFFPNALAYDMMYGRETPFMKFARENGARVADGLGMLVEQAAEAFYMWRGVHPDTTPVIAALRLP